MYIERNFMFSFDIMKLSKGVELVVFELIPKLILYYQFFRFVPLD